MVLEPLSVSDESASERSVSGVSGLYSAPDLMPQQVVMRSLTTAFIRSAVQLWDGQVGEE